MMVDMQKRIRKEDVNQLATKIVAIATASNENGARSVMAEMGSKGGKIGGKRRAENMSPQQRRAAASLAARARWSKTPQIVSMESKREIAVRKITAIFEEQMASLGLSEAEKDAKIAEFAAFVDSKVSSATRATQLKPLQNAALRA
jgi:hypothetical protein